MKYLFTLLIVSVVLFSCSKGKDDKKQEDRTLQVNVIDAISPTSGNHVWTVRLLFNLKVTIQGSVKVDYDIYHLGAFNKHYSQKVNFSINDDHYFYHYTTVISAPPGQGWEVKNMIVDSLAQTSGNYNITIK
jgi:hypothetical protein